MKRIGKKALCILLTLVMALGLLPGSVLAEEEKTAEKAETPEEETLPEVKDLPDGLELAVRETISGPALFLTGKPTRNKQPRRFRCSSR